MQEAWTGITSYIRLQRRSQVTLSIAEAVEPDQQFHTLRCERNPGVRKKQRENIHVSQRKSSCFAFNYDTNKFHQMACWARAQGLASKVFTSQPPVSARSSILFKTVSRVWVSPLPLTWLATPLKLLSYKSKSIIHRSPPPSQNFGQKSKSNH